MRYYRQNEYVSYTLLWFTNLDLCFQSVLVTTLKFCFMKLLLNFILFLFYEVVYNYDSDEGRNKQMSVCVRYYWEKEYVFCYDFITLEGRVQRWDR